MTINPKEISDGYHTMEELYDHRRALTAALARTMRAISWRSTEHSPADDPIFPGYFIVGIDLPTGTITYHYKLSHWNDFAKITILEHAPTWDGAAPNESIIRLLKYANNY